MTRVLMGAIAACAVAASASASTLQLNYSGQGFGSTVNVSFNNGMGATASHNGFAGQLKWNNGTVTTYCVELGQFTGNYLFNVTSVDNVPSPGPGSTGAMNATKANLIRDLFYRAYSSVNSNIAGAAMQVAIWEIAFENITETTNLDDAKSQLLASGNWASQGWFKSVAGNDNQTDINNAVTALFQSLGTGGWVLDCGPAGLTHPTGQDQLIMIPVPAPALLAGLGLIGAVAVRRRMTKA